MPDAPLVFALVLVWVWHFSIVLYGKVWYGWYLREACFFSSAVFCAHQEVS